MNPIQTVVATLLIILAIGYSLWISQPTEPKGAHVSTTCVNGWTVNRMGYHQGYVYLYDADQRLIPCKR